MDADAVLSGRLSMGSSPACAREERRSDLLSSTGVGAAVRVRERREERRVAGGWEVGNEVRSVSKKSSPAAVIKVDLECAEEERLGEELDVLLEMKEWLVEEVTGAGVWLASSSVVLRRRLTRVERLGLVAVFGAPEGALVSSS